MKRYNFVDGIYFRAADGEWVRYSDHVEAMKRIAGDGAPECDTCNGFVHVHDATGEYRGECPHCAPSASAQQAEPTRIHTNTNREFSMEHRQFSYEGNGYIQDNNFDFDAGLKISGDFVNDDKDNYCRMIVAALNAAPAPSDSGPLINKGTKPVTAEDVRANRRNGESMWDTKARLEGAPSASPICTCPSGDGSLRHPCPSHPSASPAALTLGQVIHKRLCEGNPEAASPADQMEDARRLNWMAEHEAWIAWSLDGERCRVFHRDDEGDSKPFLGWGADKNFGTVREAIDAAMSNGDANG